MCRTRVLRNITLVITSSWPLYPCFVVLPNFTCMNGGLSSCHLHHRPRCSWENSSSLRAKSLGLPHPQCPAHTAPSHPETQEENQVFWFASHPEFCSHSKGGYTFFGTPFLIRSFKQVMKHEPRVKISHETMVGGCFLWWWESCQRWIVRDKRQAWAVIRNRETVILACKHLISDADSRWETHPKSTFTPQLSSQNRKTGSFKLLIKIGYG